MTSIPPTVYQYTQPNLSSSKSGSRWYQSVSNVANRFFTAPDHIAQTSKRLTQKNNPAVKKLGQLWKQIGNHILNFDHDRRLSKHIMSPSPGAFFMIVIPFTVVPRIIQGLRRSEGKQDKSELGDILFRDFLTLFFLLYAINPVQNRVTQLIGKKLGIHLNDKDGKALGHQSLNDLYQIKDNHSIADMLSSKTKPSGQQVQGHVSIDTFKTVLNKNLKRWEAALEKALEVTPKTGSKIETKTHQILTQLQTKVKDSQQLLKKLSSDTLKAPHTLKQFSKQGFQSIHDIQQQLDTQLKPALNTINKNQAQHQSIKQVARILKRAKLMAPSEGLAHYAKRGITAISAGSFLVVAGLIGTFPPFANTWRNALVFQRKENKQRHEQARRLLNQWSV